MYIPIAFLYNERGIFRGFRCFQWFEKGEEPVDIIHDICPKVVLRRDSFEIIQSDVVELVEDEILSCKCKFYDFPANTDRFVGVFGRKYMAKVLADGTVLDDAVLLLCEVGTTDVIVVDATGRYQRFNRGLLFRLRSKSDINMDSKVMTSAVYTTNGLRFATKAFKAKLNSLVAQCSLYGLYVSYNAYTGVISCNIEASGTVILPDGLDDVTLRSSSTVTELLLPNKCGLLCDSRTLRGIQVPNDMYTFSLDVSCPMRALSLPKSIQHLASFTSAFYLRLTDIPNNLTCIDQTQYDIERNTVIVSGENNLQRIKLMCVGSSAVLDISNSEQLHSIELLKPLNSVVSEAEARIQLGVVQGILEIKSYVSPLKLKLYVYKPETGIIYIRHTRYASNMHVFLNIPFKDWSASDNKRLAVIIYYQLFLELDSLTSKGYPVSTSGWLKCVRVQSVMDARKRAEDFCSGLNVQKDEEGIKVLVIYHMR